MFFLYFLCVGVIRLADGKQQAERDRGRRLTNHIPHSCGEKMNIKLNGGCLYLCYGSIDRMFVCPIPNRILDLYAHCTSCCCRYWCAIKQKFNNNTTWFIQFTRLLCIYESLCVSVSLSLSLSLCLCPSSACNRKFNKCATRSKAQLMRRQITLRRCRLRLRISCGR